MCEGGDAGFLVDLAAVLAGVVEQELVESRAVHLVSVFVITAEMVGEPDAVVAGVVTGGELRAVFADETGVGHFIPDADFAQEVIAVGQE